MMVIKIIPVDVPEYASPYDKEESTEQNHVPYFRNTANNESTEQKQVLYFRYTAKNESTEQKHVPYFRYTP